MRVLLVLLFASLHLLIAGCRRSGDPAGPAVSPEETTKQLVDRLSAELQRRMERFETEIEDSLNVEAYLEFARGEGTGKDDPFEGDAVCRRRARVLARLDAIRSAFPQFFCEIMQQPRFAEGLRGGVILNAMRAKDMPSTGSEIFRSLALGTSAILSPHPTFEALRQAFEKQSALSQSSPDDIPGSFYPESHDPATESSECLYLILSEPRLGPSMVESIPERFIQDTDGDGLLEFVDAWGQPLRYYRWPTDYYAFLIDVTRQMESLYPDGLRSDEQFEEDEYARLLSDAGLGDEALLYARNWTHPEHWKFWGVEMVSLRERNAMVEETLTFRTHQLYDIRADGRNLELFLHPPDNFPIDFGFGLSHKPLYSSASLQTSPRWYPRSPLVVSAGPDGRLGLYTPEVDNPRGDRPAAYRPRSPMWAALQLDYRCGRVDARFWESALDNILSIDLPPPADVEELRLRFGP